MTVAAVILAASPASALANADGTPAVRRLADVAWAGGATPVVVVAHDPDGEVGRALANAEVTLADPAPLEGGPVGQIAHGIAVARELVTETDAALVWPARMAWVDAETVTTLLAAHGTDREAMLRPAYAGEPGWPALVPMTAVASLAALPVDRLPEGLLDDLVVAGVPVQLVESGDPGTVYDVSTARDALPRYDGPPEPAEGHRHEWGEGVADASDDAPVPGPARVAMGPGSRD
jgi:CTP:molybdopterin cytidylyltransferase MocA